MSGNKTISLNFEDSIDDENRLARMRQSYSLISFTVEDSIDDENRLALSAIPPTGPAALVIEDSIDDENRLALPSAVAVILKPWV